MDNNYSYYFIFIKSYGKNNVEESFYMEKVENIICIKNINKKLNNKTVFENFHIDFYKNQINEKGLLFIKIVLLA